VLGAFEPQDPGDLFQQFDRFARQVHFNSRSDKS
jgi:hypothetical protein